MAKLSRRNLLAGAVAAPVIAKGHLSSVTLTVSSSPDRLIAAAAEWIAADQHLSAMELRWQDFESRLFAKARQTNESCATAQSSDLPEAQAMRELEIEIEAACLQRETLAEAVSHMPATTIASAVAKIELGLKVQGPFDWRDHALELLEGGIAELREVLSHSCAATFSSSR